MKAYTYGVLVYPPACGTRGGVDLQQAGVPTPGNPHTTLNFVGAIVTDNGAGKATITIASSSSVRTDRPVTATGNARVFLTEVKVLTEPFCLYHNGRRLLRDWEYRLEESGGAGTGFDTIRLLLFTPSAISQLSTDYAPF